MWHEGERRSEREKYQFYLLSPFMSMNALEQSKNSRIIGIQREGT